MSIFYVEIIAVLQLIVCNNKYSGGALQKNVGFHSHSFFPSYKRLENFLNCNAVFHLISQVGHQLVNTSITIVNFPNYFLNKGYRKVVQVKLGSLVTSGLLQNIHCKNPQWRISKLHFVPEEISVVQRTAQQMVQMLDNVLHQHI